VALERRLILLGEAHCVAPPMGADGAISVPISSW
jgi:hypothetical protein